MTAEVARYAPRRAIAGWLLFDPAAQPFFTLIITFVYAPYFASAIAANPVEGQALWGFATAGAALVVALFSPILGAIADASGRRKPWIAGFGVLVVIGASLLVVRQAGRRIRHSAGARRLCDRRDRHRVRGRVQQRHDADARAAASASDAYPAPAGRSGMSAGF